MEEPQEFPKWKPHYRTEEWFDGTSRRSWEKLRYATSSFSKNKTVRKMIMEKCNYKCAICGATEELQIDHIKSVYYAFHHKEFIPKLNTYDNMQILCKSCNSSKAP